MTIGARVINGVNCIMEQVKANVIIVSPEGMGHIAFVGACDNLHIEIIWQDMARRLPLPMNGTDYHTFGEC